MNNPFTQYEQEVMSALYASLNYCEENDLDVESVSKLVSSNMKEKIQYEAENLNMLPKTVTRFKK